LDRILPVVANGQWTAAYTQVRLCDIRGAILLLIFQVLSTE